MIKDWLSKLYCTLKPQPLDRFAWGILQNYCQCQEYVYGHEKVYFYLVLTLESSFLYSFISLNLVEIST